MDPLEEASKRSVDIINSIKEASNSFSLTILAGWTVNLTLIFVGLIMGEEDLMLILSMVLAAMLNVGIAFRAILLSVECHHLEKLHQVCMRHLYVEPQYNKDGELIKTAVRKLPLDEPER